MSIAIVVARSPRGSILFHDWMYPESRMFFTDKLVSMGAQIVLCDPHRCIVQGPARLFGEKLESPDIPPAWRSSWLLWLPKVNRRFATSGRSERGYEKVDEKLRSLGAAIRRESD